MTKRIEKKSNLWYFIGFVYLFMATAFFFSEKIAYIFSEENYLHVANTFFDNGSYDVPTDAGLNAVYNTEMYVVKTSLQTGADPSAERFRINKRIYNNYNSTSTQVNRNETAGNQNINFQAFDQIENISHQNDNSRQLNTSFPNLNSHEDISQVFSSVFKRDDDVNNVFVEENTSLETSLLVSDISLSVNNNENGVYQQSGIDPNGDPIEEPIPVGDGSWLLLVIVLFYAGRKYKKLRLQEPLN